MLRYIIHRCLHMLVIIALISVVIFAIIQLPPGDYLSTLQAELAAEGMQGAVLLERLRARYGLDQPLYAQYLRWIGGIVLRGDFAWSFEWNRPVGELIWNRLGLSVALSLTSMLLTFAIALPIGIYSAVRQYSIGDYLASIFGFLGLATPNFLLALVMMWISFSVFGWNVGGLFSSEFERTPWSWARFVDFLQHIWIPLVVIATAGTAGLIRVTRANLLDELNKPYVEAARAKGLSETRLILKYPVRLALNPFFSTVGWLLPALISGETIVSIVVDLPTIGPLLLRSLLAQDMYLAGGVVFLISVLTVIGTLLSDFALAWADPRIRYE